MKISVPYTSARISLDCSWLLFSWIPVLFGEQDKWWLLKSNFVLIPIIECMESIICSAPIDTTEKFVFETIINVEVIFQDKHVGSSDPELQFGSSTPTYISCMSLDAKIIIWKDAQKCHYATNLNNSVIRALGHKWDTCALVAHFPLLRSVTFTLLIWLWYFYIWDICHCVVKNAR